jgi:hypothetical protein
MYCTLSETFRNRTYVHIHFRKPFGRGHMYSYTFENRSEEDTCTAHFRKPFGKGHMYIYNFCLRMTDTISFQNIDLFSWDILYMWITQNDISQVEIWTSNFPKKEGRMLSTKLWRGACVLRYSVSICTDNWIVTIKLKWTEPILVMDEGKARNLGRHQASQ